MRRYFFALLPAAAVMMLTACGGGSVPARTVAQTGAQQRAPIATMANGQAFNHKYFFVTNFGNSTVTKYAADASGNTAPVATFSLGVVVPEGLAVGPTELLYVADSTSNGVTVYDGSVNGSLSPAPVAAISGSQTQIDDPGGMAVTANGDLWLASFLNGEILEFARGANGNVAPIAAIAGSQTGLSSPGVVALQPNGTLYVINEGYQNGLADSITVYSAGSSGNAAPIRTITGPDTQLVSWLSDIIVRPDGTVFAIPQYTNSILEFAPGANGDAAPEAVLQGSATQLNLPSDVAFDAQGNMYVSDTGSNAVTVYAAGATGNAAPIAVLSGSATGLNEPSALRF